MLPSLICRRSSFRFTIFILPCRWRWQCFLRVREPTRAVLGVLNTNLPPETRNSTPRKRRGKQRKKLSPQTSRILKKEQNRLRSKAYRERKKLELETLQQELRAARCELADGQCKVTATATTMKRKKSLFRN